MFDEDLCASLVVSITTRVSGSGVIVMVGCIPSSLDTVYILSLIVSSCECTHAFLCRGYSKVLLKYNSA